jgi:hypothetical protein
MKPLNHHDIDGRADAVRVNSKTNILHAAMAFALMAAVPGVAFAGLVGHWSLDGTADDSSGHGHNGFLMGIGKDNAAMPSIVPGKFGQAVTFDGHTAVEIPIDLDYQTHRKLTVSMWINLNGTKRGAQMETLLSTGAGNGPKIMLARDKLRATGGNKTVGPNVSLSADGWNFVAVTWDHEAGDMHIYANNAEAYYPLGYQNKTAQKTYASPRDPDYPTLGHKAQKRYLWLGAKDAFGKGYSLKGVSIDDVRIFDAALTPEELADVSDGRSDGIIVSKVPFNLPSSNLAITPSVRLEGDPDRPIITGAAPGAISPQRLPGDQYVQPTSPQQLPGDQYVQPTSPQQLPGDQYTPPAAPIRPPDRP